MEKHMTELKKEKVLLENQLEMEKMKVEAEKKKLILSHEQLREKVGISSGNSVVMYVVIFSHARHAIRTGPLAHDHLIWPLDHLVWHSTGPDWPPSLK